MCRKSESHRMEENFLNGSELPSALMPNTLITASNFLTCDLCILLLNLFVDEERSENKQQDHHYCEQRVDKESQRAPESLLTLMPSEHGRIILMLVNALRAQKFSANFYFNPTVFHSYFIFSLKFFLRLSSAL